MSYPWENLSSDIPQAREHLKETEKYQMHPYARHLVRKALSLMTRAHAVRRAPTKQRLITEKQKRTVKALKDSDLSYQEIAIETGLENAGRVSEIMTGKR